MPAFRGYNVHGLNLVEVGHSTMARQEKRVKLMVAMMKDVIIMMKQDSDYTDFLENIRTRIGRGPIQVDERVRERQHDRCMVEQFIEVLESGDIEGKIGEDLQNAESFVPTRRSQHRVPTNFPSRNPTQ